MGIYSRTDEILDFVRDLKANWGSDPFQIAERIGLRIVNKPSGRPGAYIISFPPYPSIMFIHGNISDTARSVLCAHELGHALLHKDQAINRFDGTTAALQGQTEYEANLFAVALLFDEDAFNRPLSGMPNSLLKLILDYNVG